MFSFLTVKFRSQKMWPNTQSSRKEKHRSDSTRPILKKTVARPTEGTTVITNKDLYHCSTSRMLYNEWLGARGWQPADPGQPAQRVKPAWWDHPLQHRHHRSTNRVRLRAIWPSLPYWDMTFFSSHISNVAYLHLKHAYGYFSSRRFQV